MKVFLTSDTHYGAERTKQFSYRPFGSTNEMDEYIMNLHNRDASDDDLIYHLGDFGDYEMVSKLNGRITLVCGNYEQIDIEGKYNGDFPKFREYLLQLGFYDVIKHRTWLEDIPVTHKPSDCYKDRFNCFGHIHGSCKLKRFGLNVGVDCHFFQLVPWELVKQYRTDIKEYCDEEIFM